MSDKTLVERLRDSNSAYRNINCVLADVVFGDEKTAHCSEENCNSCKKMTILRLADAIEREYLPRPRFEDGEPVQFGDMAKVREDLGDVIEMVYQDGKCVEVVIGFGDEETASHYTICEGERVKRPELEVLDADGVPINVGDTVYVSKEHWTAEIGDGAIVESIKGGIVYTSDDGAWSGDYLTHKKPDSLERIEEDAEKNVCVYFAKQGNPKCDDCDKALGPYLECHREMMLDLLNRQREVLERNHER